MTSETTLLIGRIADEYKVQLKRGDCDSWTASLVTKTWEPIQILGTYEGVDRARRESEFAARKLLESRGIPTEFDIMWIGAHPKKT